MKYLKNTRLITMRSQSNYIEVLLLVVVNIVVVGFIVFVASYIGSS